MVLLPDVVRRRTDEEFEHIFTELFTVLRQRSGDITAPWRCRHEGGTASCRRRTLHYELDFEPSFSHNRSKLPHPLPGLAFALTSLEQQPDETPLQE